MLGLNLGIDRIKKALVIGKTSCLNFIRVLQEVILIKQKDLYHTQSILRLD